MDDLIPAFIGLFGVVVGGIIQVAFQAQQARTEQVTEMRRHVGELSAAVSNYLNGLDLATEYMTRAHVEGPNKERIAEEAKNIANLRHELLILVAKLVASGDWRISDQSSELAHKVGSLSSSLQEIWVKPKPQDRQIFLQGQEAVSYEFNVLLAMVAPTVFDRHLRFRSAKSAERYLETSHQRRKI